jgi:regulator of replication initiation timing
MKFIYIQNGAHTKRLLDETSPRQNVSIQNVYTHNVSLTKRLRNETSPVTKRLRNKTSPRHIFNVLHRLFKNGCRICRVLFFVVRLGSAVKAR